MKTKIRIAILTLMFILFAQFSSAQEGTERISVLQEKIKSAQSISAARQELEELVNLSFQEEKFDQLYDFLVGLEQNLDAAADPYLYYCQALTRFTQMQVLNEKQMWQELFDNKDAYTQQLNAAIDKAVKLNSGVNETALRLKFIQAEMLKENENDFLSAMEDLFNLAREYAQTEANPQVIKDIADELSRQKQAVYARKLYNVYVSKLAESDISQEDLLKIAQDFLDENNADLSVSLYDAYTDKLVNSQQDKTEIIKQMLDVAEKFRHTGWQEGKDPFFAERLYAKLESLYGLEAFDAVSQYKRAYNLERIREYESCLKEYLKLVND